MSRFRKPGGGFLNGENGTIVNYQFKTSDFEGAKGTYTKLSVELEIMQDGNTDTVQQFLDAGFFYDGSTVSKDGYTLESDDERTMLVEGTEFADFITAMLANGLDENDLPEDGRNFEAINGKRVTFIKVLDTERQMAAGRKKLGKKAAGASNEEIMAAGRQQDKKDKTKFYNHQRLSVSAVLGEASTKGKTVAKADGVKPAKSAPKANGSESAKFLRSVLADAGEPIKVDKLSSVLVSYCLNNDVEKTERDLHRKVILADGFLESQQGWVLDSKAKTIAEA